LLLNGVKVLSLCHYLQGPAAAQYLADMGADVVKIEPLAGAYERRWSGASTFVGDVSAFFLCANRNKRSLTIDLKAADGKATFLRLVAQADVVMENFRPGTLDRLGLGYEALQEANPRIIFASASGYGADGPYANNPGQDLLVQARTGLVAATAGQQPDVLPSAAGCAVVDQHGAALFAMGILAALYRLRTTGQGTRVESSLFNAGIDLQQESISTYLNGNWTPEVFRRERHLATWFHEAPYGVFGCSDGVYVALSLNNLANLIAAFEELQHSDQAADALQRLRNFRGDKFTERDTIATDVATILGGQLRQIAMDAMERFDVWYAPVTSYAELSNDPQAVHNGVFTSHEVQGRKALFVTHPNRYDGKVPEILHIAEHAGADRDSVLQQYGFSHDEIASLVERGVVGSSFSGAAA
jgi:crotonobetainyl-CoA:carnitine CoA-transferase CaiB-like acyl-CoA transferase